MEDSFHFDNEGRESDECREASVVALTRFPFAIVALLLLFLLMLLA